MILKAIFKLFYPLRKFSLTIVLLLEENRRSSVFHLCDGSVGYVPSTNRRARTNKYRNNKYTELFTNNEQIIKFDICCLFAIR